MNKAFTIVELLVVITIIVILAGMLIPAINLVRNSANKARMAEKGTEVSPDAWKMSGNMTPSGAVQTYIITDPTNNQKWIVVSRNSNNCSIIPYVPAPITPEVAR